MAKIKWEDVIKYCYTDEVEPISGSKNPSSAEEEEIPDIDHEEWQAILQSTIPHGSENIKE